MRYWWVNHNKTGVEETRCGFLWAPKTKVNGGRNPFYDTMVEVAPGDLVYSFRGTRIVAVGVAQSYAETTLKPASFNDINWDSVGWKVDVEFVEVATPPRIQDNLDLLAPFAGIKYSPLDKNGDGKQGVYLAEISQEFARILTALCSLDVDELKEEFAPNIDRELEAELAEIIQLKQISGDVEKMELVKSRRGQGLFKNNVRFYERSCRITGVANPVHLRASHIKPWSKSDVHEKLDGSNGLLLSPHVDHLFDRGFISFRNTGEILIAKELDREVLSRWSINSEANVGGFTNEQSMYLDYHRDEIFQRAV